jgi:TonB family protein
MHSRETRPQVLGTRTLVVALLLHVAFFLVFWIVSLLNFKPKETVIPIDLTVVVNENLDGKEDEPPPLEQTKPEPPPPPPKPEPKVEPPPPPKAEKVEAVEMVKEPPKKKEEKKPEKKEEKKKPEPPKKTREQIMKERIAQMRKNATTVKTPIVVKNVPSGNGRTDKKRLSDEEVRKLLNQGYVPGRSEQIAQSEMQRCASLIKMALDRRWSELSPTIDREGTVVLEAQFTDAGRLINCRVVRSCGSALSDKAALSVASSVGVIFGLSPEFIAKSRNSPIQINYSVRGGR